LLVVSGALETRRAPVREGSPLPSRSARRG
jgi:hypothetical protein